MGSEKSRHAQDDWRAFEIVDADGLKGAGGKHYVDAPGMTAVRIAVDYVEAMGFERKAWNAELSDGDEIVVAVVRPGVTTMADAEVFRVVVNLKPTYEPHSAGTLAEFRARAAAGAE